MPTCSKAVTIIEPGKIEVREYKIPPVPTGSLLMKIEMSVRHGQTHVPWRDNTIRWYGQRANITIPVDTRPRKRRGGR